MTINKNPFIYDKILLYCKTEPQGKITKIDLQWTEANTPLRLSGCSSITSGKALEYEHAEFTPISPLLLRRAREVRHVNAKNNAASKNCATPCIHEEAYQLISGLTQNKIDLNQFKFATDLWPWSLFSFDQISDFRLKVYLEISKIPFGSTISYQELAVSLGSQNYARAVAQALGKNPFPLLFPCHRIIQKNGLLGGFSQGIEIKKFLLSQEKNLLLQSVKTNNEE